MPITAAFIIGGATLGAAGLSAVATWWASSEAASGTTEAAKIASAENARIEALKIRFAREESGREMDRFNRSQFESARQFDTGLGQRKAESAQQESQHSRTLGQRISEAIDAKRQFGLTHEETKRQFGLTFGEGKRQFEETLGQRRAESAQQESQFARTHELKEDQLGMDKTQMIFDNRQAMRTNILNLANNNNKFRMQFADYFGRSAA